MRGDSYSRMVAWLKVALPLLALGILSTLFLISRAVDPPKTIPFADSEVQARLTNRQITGPYFSGTTTNGDEISFMAETVSTPNGSTNANQAEIVDIQIKMVSGTRLFVTSDRADVDLANDRTDLAGDVEIVSSTGYTLRSELLHLRLSHMEMTSPNTVTGNTPVGDLEAGAMHLFTPEGATGSQLLFTGGVKLLYQQKPLEE